MHLFPTSDEPDWFTRNTIESVHRQKTVPDVFVEGKEANHKQKLATKLAE